jgi:exonuclease SbcD
MSQARDTLLHVSIKLLHCADLHLDAVLGNSLSTSQNEHIEKTSSILLRDAPLLALKNISMTAIQEKVDLVLIAGDLFNMKDDSAMNHRVRSNLLDFFKELETSDIKVFIAVGNHDPLKHIYEMSLSWPKNVHLFNEKNVETINFEIRGQNVSVHGVSYKETNEERKLASYFPPRTNADYNFALLHTNVGGNENHSNYAPSDIKTLTSYNYDYFALGHIHKRTILNENPLIAYSGNPQGFSSKPSECEAKGVYIIELAAKGEIPNIKFIVTDVVRYVNDIIEIESAISVEELSENIISKLENNHLNVDQFILSRLVLTINNFEGTYLDNDELKNIINENLISIHITDLKVATNISKFEELKDISEYFQCIDQELEHFEDIDFDDLYGKQSEKIKNILTTNTSTLSADTGQEFTQEIKEFITKIQNEISVKAK